MTALKAFPARLRREVVPQRPLAPLTTMRIGGPAEYYVEAHSLRDALDALNACRLAALPLHVLGGGSNLLIDDAGVPGLVLNLKPLTRIQPYGSKVVVQAGASLTALVAACARAGIAGPEGLAGIPGSVGGALAMNAGGRYAEIGEFVDRVLWLSPGGSLTYLYREEIQFAYRQSSLRQGIVLEAILEGRPGQPSELLARMKQIMEQKLAAQPYRAHSAGCAFTNPPGQSAGRLIDLAGCKGLQVGGARVSEQHANFIVNTGEATFEDVTGLMALVQKRVQDAHGVQLIPEVKAWPQPMIVAA
ncbi:UDP-N-acetylmuramate dehydrogenase [bacterium]|nr:MAG: UDP-N-acetylmuramate dehydrogenase [bacterium]RIK64046.1 MAG: UDP-N-acetylenolpyruvoylglucosamine reductase [Planctomycetota bacterium]